MYVCITIFCQIIHGLFNASMVEVKTSSQAICTSYKSIELHNDATAKRPSAFQSWFTSNSCRTERWRPDGQSTSG
uniref:Uncharacterized protein n=1 Tax=Arundo donax TaxID=35708 RepID=A0A0A9ED58_ARUDO